MSTTKHASINAYIPLAPDGRPMAPWKGGGMAYKAAAAYPGAAGVAVILDAVGWVVLDLDRKGGKDGVKVALDALDLDSEDALISAASLVVKTPSGGLHLYYTRPPDVPIGRYVGADGVDVLAAGLVTLPGSRRGGKEYVAVRRGTPTEPPDAVHAWLVERATDARLGQYADSGAYRVYLRGGKVPQGQRAHHFISLAGFLAAKCRDVDELRRWLEHFDAHHHDPPLRTNDAATFRAIVRWAEARHRRDGGGDGFELEPKRKAERPPKGRPRKEEPDGDAKAAMLAKLREIGRLDTDRPRWVKIGGYVHELIYDAGGGIESYHRYNVADIRAQTGLTATAVLNALEGYDGVIVEFAPPGGRHQRFVERAGQRFINLAAPPPFTPVPSSEIPPATRALLEHISGGSPQLMRVLLEWIKVSLFDINQKLPLLALVSPERRTGKSTLLEWLSALHGGNAVVIDSKTLESDFTAPYARARYIYVDEALISKRTAIERLKFLITANEILYNQKHVSAKMMPFRGVFAMASNSEKFLNFHEEKDRYLLIPVSPIPAERHIPELRRRLRDEAPAFLGYLKDHVPLRPPAERERLYFKDDEIMKKLTIEFLPVWLEEAVEAIHEAAAEWVENARRGHVGVPDWVKVDMLADGDYQIAARTRQLYEMIKAKVSIDRLSRRFVMRHLADVLDADGKAVRFGAEVHRALVFDYSHLRRLVGAVDAAPDAPESGTDTNFADDDEPPF